MSFILVAAIIGLIFALLTNQNTAEVTLRLAGFSWGGVPLFAVILGSFLVGLVVAWVVHLLDQINASKTVSEKNKMFEDERRKSEELSKKVTEVEAENSRLKTERDMIRERKDMQRNPEEENLVDRIRQNLGL